MFETFEHTADVGLRIRSNSLPTLLAEAGRGLFSLIVPDLGSVRPTVEHRVKLTAEAPDLLLFDWLGELLFLFDTQRLLFCEFDLQLDGLKLVATCRGEPIEPARHVLDHEVKAITYHGLKVEQQPGGDWLAEVIVDI